MDVQNALLNNEVLTQTKEKPYHSIMFMVNELFRTMRLHLVDYSNPDSCSYKCRMKRFGVFERLTSDLSNPHIVDVGGTQYFWKMMQFTKEKQSDITLLNLTASKTTSPNFTSLIGDATNMAQFQDKEFDIAFSNSVIEHVGDFEQQMKMANEIMRVGNHYCLQTPSKYFPIEPHFLFPLFQFLPETVKVFLTTHFSIGSFDRQKSREEAAALVNSVRLLSKKELQVLFPNAKVYKEKFMFITKSYIVYA